MGQNPRYKSVTRQSTGWVSILALITSWLIAASVQAEVDGLELATDTAIESENCLYARQIKNIDIVDEQMLVLRGTANRFWLSRLPNKCDGLKDRMHLVVDRYGSRLCRNDRFEAHERGGGFFASCHFGSFEPVSAGSIDALKVAAAGR